MHKMILKLGSFSICGKSFRNLRLWRVPFSRRSFMAASGSPRRNGERLSLIEGHSWRSVRCASFNATKKELGGNWVHGQEGNRAVLNDMGSEDKEEQIRDQNPNPRLLTLPTILTLGRVAAVPLLVTTFYMNGYWATTATTSIFIIAAVTDWLDGYLARKMRLGTAFGAFLDPVADKLMVAATLVLLCTKPFEVAMFGQVPWLLTVPSIAIIGREITMSAVREWAASQSRSTLEAVAVNNFGKWKTATQMIAITILLATRDSSQGSLSIIAASGIFLLYTSAGLSVWSLAVYMRGIWRILLK